MFFFFPQVTIVHEPARFHIAEVAPAVTVREYVTEQEVNKPGFANTSKPGFADTGDNTELPKTQRDTQDEVRLSADSSSSLCVHSLHYRCSTCMRVHAC
jgi:hypothetical protein